MTTTEQLIPTSDLATRLKIAVIIGSGRKGRFADVIVNWFMSEAIKHAAFEFDLIDLADVDPPASLTFLLNDKLQNFVDRVSAADGFIIVVPEYNHSFPASLKAAIDLPYKQWNAKPVAFVSYGGGSGGIRAVEQLRQIFIELHAVPTRDAVHLANSSAMFDEAGNILEPESRAAAAKMLLDQLEWWGLTLREGRSARPYGG